MNTKALKSVMVLHGDNIVSLANYLGISEQSFRNKMRENGTSFKQGEIAMIVDQSVDGAYPRCAAFRRTQRSGVHRPAPDV